MSSKQEDVLYHRTIKVRSVLEQFKKDPYLGPYVLVSVTLVSILCFRLVHIQITHDEAYSFWLTSTLNIRQMVGTANNHWLNSVFMWMQQQVFGNEVWMLRVHNLLAYLLLLVYGSKFFYRKDSKATRWVFVCLVLCNTYLLDYFVLARGYGLGCGLAMAGLYYYKCAIDSENHKMFKVYIFLGLATLSNYTFIYIICAVFVLDSWRLLRRGQGFNRIISWPFIIQRLPFLITLLWSVPNILFIKYHTGDLEEGLKNGIIKDTVSGFFLRSYTGLMSDTSSFIFSISLMVFIFFTYFYFYRMLSSCNKRMCELLFLLYAMVQINFYVLHTPFPYARVSIYFNFILLIVLVELMSFYFILLKPSIKAILLLGFTIIAMFGFCNSNIYVSSDFWMSQGVKEAIRTIRNAEAKAQRPTKVLMSEDHIGAFINYYSYLDTALQQWKISAYYRTDTTTLTEIQKIAFAESTYCLLVPQYEAYFKKHVQLNYYNLVADYPLMKAKLYRKK